MGVEFRESIFVKAGIVERGKPLGTQDRIYPRHWISGTERSPLVDFAGAPVVYVSRLRPRITQGNDLPSRDARSRAR